MEPEWSVLEIAPTETATACLILLHGLGADGHDLAPLAAVFEPAVGSAVRYLFPHAPYRPVTINGGSTMRAWYDIRAMDLDAPEDERGIRASAEYVQGLIDQQAAVGIAPRRVVLGGFSQGGAIALYAGLTYPRRIGGILALSTYLPLFGHFARHRPVAEPATPIMMAHGSADPVVPFEYGRISARRLVRLGYTVAWKDYPMGHTLCDDEIGAAAAWLSGILTEQA